MLPTSNIRICIIEKDDNKNNYKLRTCPKKDQCFKDLDVTFYLGIQQKKISHYKNELALVAQQNNGHANHHMLSLPMPCLENKRKSVQLPPLELQRVAVI